MKVQITEKTALKIKEKHGIDYDDVLTIFEGGAEKLDFRTGKTGISFGITVSGKAVTVITVRKDNIRWIKTARLMTESEKSVFRKSRR